MKTPSLEDVIIVGSGPAGLTAAIYAARANLAPLVLDGPRPGGPLVTTPEIENFPGFPDGIGGWELLDQMRRQAEKFGARFLSVTAKSVDLKAAIKKITLENGDELHTKTLIIATGANYRTLGLPEEGELLGKGVSYCATCDGAFFRGVPIAVVGGGDTAMEEALFLTRFASEVHVIHRRDEFRAAKIMADRVKEHSKIKIHWNSVVKNIQSADGKVSGLVLQDTLTQETRELAVSAVFVAVGLVPASAAFADALPIDESGYLQPQGVLTPYAGVFIAGDVGDSRYRQAISAAGTGCRAAIEAVYYLQETQTP